MIGNETSTPQFDPLADVKYKRLVASERRVCGGPDFWLTADRPFSEAITDLLMDAWQCNKRPFLMSKRVSEESKATVIP